MPIYVEEGGIGTISPTGLFPKTNRSMGTGEGLGFDLPSSPLLRYVSGEQSNSHPRACVRSHVYGTYAVGNILSTRSFPLYRTYVSSCGTTYTPLSINFPMQISQGGGEGRGVHPVLYVVRYYHMYVDVQYVRKILPSSERASEFHQQ